MVGFRVSIELGDPMWQHLELLQALVGTGASYTVVPATLLQHLDVVPHTRDRFKLAGGSLREYDIGETRIRVDGRSVTSLVAEGDEGTEPLLGAHTLEGLRLVPDPVGQQLIPVPSLLM